MPDFAAGGGGAEFQLRGKMKGRARALLAHDADLALHHLDQLLGDRQAEAGAAIAARNRLVDLLKGVEQVGLGLFVYADAGVADLEVQHDRTVALPQ